MLIRQLNNLQIKIPQPLRLLPPFLLLLLASGQCFAGGKILGTPGVAQFEGAGGGGLVPWAQLAGYATADEVGVSGACSHADVRDFRLNTCALQLNLFDRVELSYARQEFDVLPLDLLLEQNVAGIKVRLFGDVVYSAMPQVSLGAQHKTLQTDEVAFALGADDNSGTDVYLAVSKLHLGAVFGYNLLWNLTGRYTEANEAGLLGFGGPDDFASVQLEGSVAVLLNKNIAVGVEYRQKPDNLGLDEHDWHDVFIAWFPNKHISVTAAYIDLGTIAQVQGQTGWYVSLMGYY